jgi:hypothetical protein
VASSPDRQTAVTGYEEISHKKTLLKKSSFSKGRNSRKSCLI